MEQNIIISMRQNKEKMRNAQIGTGWGNEFIERMSGWPIQKVHKMKQKKREKLTKYLWSNLEPQLNIINKEKLQNGIGVSINPTPDYKYSKIINKSKDTFKDEVINQLKSIRQATDYKRKWEKDADAKLVK